LTRLARSIYENDDWIDQLLQAAKLDLEKSEPRPLFVVFAAWLLLAALLLAVDCTA